MMTNQAGNFGDTLIETIKSKDARQSLSMVQQLRQKMRDATVGADYVVWITEPVNLTRVHKALAEDLSVPPKLLVIKRLALSRPTKADLLTQAMEGAIKRVHQL
jgi:hypothetical protein